MFRSATVLLLVACACVACSPGAGPQPGPSPSAVQQRVAAVAGRAAHTATSLKSGEVLVVGGCVSDGCSNATSTAALVEPGGAVVATGPLHVGRDSHTATLLADGSVLVVGGFAAEGQPPLASAERWFAGSNSWLPTGTMTTARGGHAAAWLGGDRVLVAGGWVASHTYTDTTEIFDPAGNRFVAGPRLPLAVDGLAAATLPDGSVLVAGGQSSPGVATNVAVLIRPDGTLVQVAGMAHRRFKHTMVTLPSGEVLVIGGTDNDQRLLTSTEIFDPHARSFRAGPALLQGRYKLSGSAAVLSDGRVVVAGGAPGAEVIDVANVRSTELAGAGAARASFSTVNILGGQVLVLGGYDERIRLTRLFERLDAGPPCQASC